MMAEKHPYSLHLHQHFNGHKLEWDAPNILSTVEHQSNKMTTTMEDQVTVQGIIVYFCMAQL